LSSRGEVGPGRLNEGDRRAGSGDRLPHWFLWIARLGPNA